MNELNHFLSQSLCKRLALQKEHSWHVSPLAIKQVVAIPPGAWLYWRELFLYQPDELELPAQHEASHGFSPILSLGQTEDGFIAALIATRAEPFPVWVAPADFIRRNGLDLMKVAAAYQSDRPTEGIDQVFLRSAVVTSAHPDKCSPTAVVSLCREFEQLLDAHGIDWNIHPNLKDQGFNFFD
jgi:hypothetical protein